MNKKVVYTITVILVLVLIAALIYFFYVKKLSLKNLIANPKDIINLVKNKAPENTNEPVVKINVNEEEKPKVERPKTDEKKEFNKEDVARLASWFTERFGSYSNQANNSNIFDLKQFMTNKMQVWADSYLAEQGIGSKDNSVYYGITTKAVASDVKDFDDAAGNAVVVVHTRRQETETSTSNVANAFNQDITISLAKEGGVWKIDSAKWETK